VPIVSSSFALDPAPEVDGRQYVTETHVDQYGVAITADYLADVGADFNAIMAARAVQLSQSLIDGEIEAVLGNGT